MTAMQLQKEPPEAVADWIGLPFELRGRTRAGVDCYGLFYLIQEQILGKVVPSFPGQYDKEARLKQVRNAMNAGRGGFVCTQRPVFGDLALWTLGHQPYHVGVMVAQGMMLHIDEPITSCLQRFPDAGWPLSRLEGYFTYQGAHAVRDAA